MTGAMPEGATATDLVLMVIQMLRQKGVVQKFVESFERIQRSNLVGMGVLPLEFQGGAT